MFSTAVLQGKKLLEGYLLPALSFIISRATSLANAVDTLRHKQMCKGMRTHIQMCSHYLFMHIHKFTRVAQTCIQTYI